MSFVHDVTVARLHFTKAVKQSGVPAYRLTVTSDFFKEEGRAFVFAEDAEENYIAIADIPLNPKAWNSRLRTELERMFRGSLVVTL